MKNKLIIVLLLAICVLLCGCEYDQREMLCTILNNEKFVEADSFDESKFSFDSFDMSRTELSENEKDKYMILITDFIKYTYRMKYTFSDVNLLEKSYEMMTNELSNMLKCSQYLENTIAGVQEFKMNIDVSNLEIYDLYGDHQSNDNGALIFATIILCIDGDTDNYISLHPELYGGDNLIDLVFNVVEENNQLRIASWYESTRDPHQVKFFSSDGINTIVELTYSDNSNMYNFE